MTLRVKLAFWIIRLGAVIKSLAVVMMRPSDLMCFNRTTYSQPQTLGRFNDDRFLDSGWRYDEKKLYENLPVKRGRLCLLGAGGGREAIQFARLGFEVTGVDFVVEMIRRAENNCADRNLPFTGLVQEISELKLDDGSFDVVWLTNPMYSYIPGRKRRIDMLERIKKALKPEGVLACQYLYEQRPDPKSFWLRKVLALILAGNFQFEKGDTILADREYVHVFFNEQDLFNEFSQAGFRAIHQGRPGANRVTGAVFAQEKAVSY